MIVFLLLLLILVGLIFYYVQNKSDPERPLKEGFAIVDKINNIDVSDYYYVILQVWKGGVGQQLFNFDGEASMYPDIDLTGTNTTKKFQIVLNEYEKNLVKRQRPNWTIDGASNILFRVKRGNLTQVNTNYGEYMNISSPIADRYQWSKPSAIANDVWPTLNGRNSVVDYLRRNGNDYFVYIKVNGYYSTDAALQGTSYTLFDAQGAAILTKYDIQVTEITPTPNCKIIGNQLSQKYRTNITIKDSATTFEILPGIAGLNETYPGTTKTNKQNLADNCKGTLIDTSHEFSRSCNSLANETYKNTFFKYGVAFNVANLSLFDGCNITDDLIGDAQATPPIPGIRSYGPYVPQSGGALIVSRELSNDGTGSVYNIRLPATARYSIGGGRFADPRQTKVLYKIEISVMNGNREVFSGAIDNVEFTRQMQLIKIVFIDGTGFVIDGMADKMAATNTYHETAGDVATFTINTYADKSYDEQYNYYSNSAGSAAASEGFLLSTTYFSIYTGTVGNTVTDASGNAITLRYSDTDKTKIIGTFSIMSAGQQVTRRLGQGRYSIFINNEPLSSVLELTQIASTINIDTKTGQIRASDASQNITSPLIEKADPQQITMQIRDASGQFIYFMTPQPFTIIGTRYPPTTAPASSVVQECFLIQQTDDKGRVDINNNIDESLVQGICDNFDGRLATIADLQADLAAGADWCEGGWIQVTPALRRVAWPVTTSMSKPTCLPASNKSITTTGTVVITQAPAVNGIICYGTKPANDIMYSLNVDNKTRYFKLVYFNKFKDQWSRKSIAEKMEVFVVEAAQPVRQNQDICMALGYVRATKAQLEEVAGDSTNTADMTVPGFVADDSVRAFTILNESARGQTGVNASAQLTVNANYCYGQKPQSRTVTATNVTYKIIDYNARRRVWSKYSDQPYKTYNLVTRTQIANETNAYRKAALIVNDIQTSGVAAVKKPNSGNAYIGCDIDAYGCKPAVAAERDTAPPQLVSRTKKFKVLEAATPINAADTSAEGMKRAIGFVLACQAAGGAVPTTDDEYPGCEGPCCAPEESANRLDASLFEEACEKPKDAIPVEECDADANLAALNQVSFEPYKLSRVLRAPTTDPAKKPAKCTTGAKLAPDFKKSITQRLFKDVHDTLKNEKLFSLRLPAGNQ